MDEATQKAFNDLTKTVGELTRTVNKLKGDLEIAKRNNELELAGAYVASSPTADGTIPFLIAGQRYNVLVDKV